MPIPSTTLVIEEGELKKTEQQSNWAPKVNQEGLEETGVPVLPNQFSAAQGKAAKPNPQKKREDC